MVQTFEEFLRIWSEQLIEDSEISTFWSIGSNDNSQTGCFLSKRNCFCYKYCSVWIIFNLICSRIIYIIINWLLDLFLPRTNVAFCKSITGDTFSFSLVNSTLNVRDLLRGSVVNLASSFALEATILVVGNLDALFRVIGSNP